VHCLLPRPRRLITGLVWVRRSRARPGLALSAPGSFRSRELCCATTQLTWSARAGERTGTSRAGECWTHRRANSTSNGMR